MISIAVYKVYFDEQLILVDKSEISARNNIKDTYWYQEYPEGNYRIVSEQKTVPVAKGVLHNWNEDNQLLNYHVHWLCPNCKKEHHTDTELISPNSELWFCEVGSLEDIVYVEW